MNKITNFRYIGENVKSVNIKPNLIFRSASIDTADSDDIQELKNLGIKYIYDFRNENEKEKGEIHKDEYFLIRNICPLANAKQYSKSAMSELTKEDNTKSMIDIYVNDLATTTIYSDFVKMILAQDSPQLLFHCTAGKDRTGIAAAILMKLLGCTDEEIYTEYLIIDPESIESVKNTMVKMFGDGLKYENVEPLLIVKKEYLDNFFLSVNKKYGTFENYIKSHLMLTNEDAQKLREIYLV